MKFDLNKDMQPWIVLINNNLKWSIALIIRIGMMVILLFAILILLRWTGLVTNFNNKIKVEADKPVVKSKPSTPTHENDIQHINNLKKLIKERLNESKVKGKENEDK